MNKTKFFCLVVLFALLATNSCKYSKKPEYLINIEYKGKLTAGQIQYYASYTGLSYDMQMLINKDIEMFRVEYNTIFQGRHIIASGIMIVPKNYLSTVPMLIYNHGTIKKNNTPSLSSSKSVTLDVILVSITSSIFGNVGIVPDFIGYGASATIEHPYIHGESLGQTIFDMVNAVIEYFEINQNTTISYKVVSVGYSEGGYATIAFQKTVQQAQTDIRVIKNYAGAGPYDNIAFIKELMLKNENLDLQHLSSYLWVLSMYKQYMGYSKAYGDIFSASDNNIFAAGNYDFGYSKTYPDINKNPQLLFNSQFIKAVNSESDTEFLQILYKNSLVDFVPKDSLILFHSQADTYVYVVNTDNAYASMQSHNAPVRKEIVPLAAREDHIVAAFTFLQNTVTNMLLTEVFR